MGLRVRVEMGWLEGNSEIDIAAIARLLGAVADYGTVRGAAKSMDLSYRTVWGRLEEAEAVFGFKLVEKSKGHGSSLTEAGHRLRNLVAEFEQLAQGRIKKDKAEFEERFRAGVRPARTRLRLACSYDMLLNEAGQLGELPDWDIRFMGSRKALDALRSGAADLAGFHVPGMASGEPFPSNFKGERGYFVELLMRRQQGLVVGRGNPLSIQGIEDLARPGVRFINRQKNADTRQWFDRLLAAKGIDPALIQGYDKEEFTHSAVAMAVGAGAADVGFALGAATLGLAVDFLPIGFESYFLCGRQELLPDPRYQTLVRLITDHAVGRGGYALPDKPTQA